MKRVGRILAVNLLCAALFVFVVRTANGQAAFGTIIGLVADPSGAAVAGAKVTATDADRGVSSDGTTNDSGNYIFTNLTPGNYKVAVEAKGFKAFIQTNVAVIVGQSTTV